MALIKSTATIPSGDSFELEQSLKLSESKTSYLSRTPTTASNRKTWTWSGWVKRGTLGVERALWGVGESSSQANVGFGLYFFTDDCLRCWVNGGQASFRTTAKYRDTSAWYHVVLKSSTVSPYFNLYVNGVEITDFSLDQRTTYPGTNNTEMNQANTVHYVGGWKNGDYYALAGYLSEVHFIDGTALTASSFGETGDYGEWKPKEVSGLTYGTNGYYLPFKGDYSVEGFSTVTWKGNAVSGNYIGGTGFKPDFTWIKQRSGPYSHVLANPISGNGRFLSAASTGAESADFTKFQNFAKDGFTVGTHAGVNANGHSYVGWNWDMGADTPTGFSAVTYKGGSSNVAGFGFSPDLVWIKSRGSTHEHILFDTLRGATKNLTTVTTAAQWTNTGGLTAFEPDGFSLGSWNDVNSSSYEYVSWGWDMGGTTATNTSGGITSTVRANTTYGQSIVKYTGTGSNSTVGHGLSAAPEMIIAKSDNAGYSWSVYHTSLASNSHTLTLDTDAKSFDESNKFTSTAPTSSVFSVGNHGTNISTKQQIAYCFHSVTGYSKISSYSGSGTSGNTITTGFRPAFVLIKNRDTAGENWYIFDSTREPLGELDTALKPDVSNADTTSSAKKVEFTSTGFKLNSTNSALNASGDTYVYYAVAGGMDSISDYNTYGSIDSRVKANPTYGQSIVSYVGNATSGATVGHGLSSTPEMIILKNRDSGTDWNVFHTSRGATKFLRLNSNVAEGTNSAIWNDTAPTSSVFSLGNNADPNSNNEDYIAYCFHSVAGYSKFGSYTGNGSTTGPSVTLGFAPAFLLIKSATQGEPWSLIDNMRTHATTGLENVLAANTDAAETQYSVDLNSNGFQIKDTTGVLNANSQTYIYMAFADKREYAYWLDQSGNNNDWTSNNLTESDISVDSPTNNFATFNPLQAGDAGSVVGTISEGNLKHYLSGSGQALTMGTIAPTTGKWYCEFTMGDPSGAGSDRCAVGIGDVYDVDIQGAGNGDKTVMVSTSTANRVWLTDNVESDNNFPARTTGSIIQFAWDIDNSKVWIGIDNQWCNSSGAVIPKSDVEAGNNATVTDTGLTSVSPLNRWSAGSSITQTHWLNCGQDSSFSGYKTAQGNQDSNDIGDFYYTPPTGFLALCTDNLTAPAVTPQEHFNTVLYTGNNTARSITGVGFASEMVWIKGRTGSNNHALFDKVRGASQRLVVDTNGADEQQTGNMPTDGFSIADGFKLGNSGDIVNGNNIPYVAWNWKANGSGSTDNSGDNNATVSANTDAKFSIVKYTGTGGEPKTIAHGLGVKPEMVIIKRTSGVGSWIVWHKDLADNYAFEGLDTNGAAIDGGSPISKYVDAVSSTLVSVGDAGENNNSGDTFIMYCWASVDGYSKVGSYTGNGNADGAFVHTSFAPAFILWKNATDAGTNWVVFDNKRDTFNPNDDALYPNATTAEEEDYDVDFLSNGFKFRNTSSWANSNGKSYIYMAFAETPFKYSNAR